MAVELDHAVEQSLASALSLMLPPSSSNCPHPYLGTQCAPPRIANKIARWEEKNIQQVAINLAIHLESVGNSGKDAWTRTSSCTLRIQLVYVFAKLFVLLRVYAL